MLHNVCKCEYTSSFKIEADYGADPIWCNICGWNLDIDDFPLSENIKDEFFEWGLQYKKKSIKAYNTIGLKLTEKVKEELGPDYKVIFIPIESSTESAGRMKRREVFKYNEDDILEILSEYLAEENGFDTFQSRVMLIGEANKDLRLIAVIGDEDDDEISRLDLEKMDKEIDYNGSH